MTAEGPESLISLGYSEVLGGSWVYWIFHRFDKYLLTCFYVPGPLWALETQGI